MEESLEGAPLDADDELLSFCPHFGAEAADALVRRLEAIGLVYVDDFFVFQFDHPGWCQFRVALTV